MLNSYRGSARARKSTKHKNSIFLYTSRRTADKEQEHTLQRTIKRYQKKPSFFEYLHVKGFIYNLINTSLHKNLGNLRGK